MWENTENHILIVMWKVMELGVVTLHRIGTVVPLYFSQCGTLGLSRILLLAVSAESRTHGS